MRFFSYPVQDSYRIQVNLQDRPPGTLLPVDIWIHICPLRHWYVLVQLHHQEPTRWISTRKQTILLLLRNMHQNVLQKVDFAALPGCAREAMLYRRNKPSVRIADDQFWRRKAAVLQAVEDALIGFRRFFRHQLNSKNITLSVFIYTTDNDDRFTDDMSCPSMRTSS